MPEEQASLRAVYDAIDDGVLVFEPSGRAVVNAAAAAWFGYPSPVATPARPG